MSWIPVPNIGSNGSIDVPQDYTLQFAVVSSGVPADNLPLSGSVYIGPTHVPIPGAGSGKLYYRLIPSTNSSFSSGSSVSNPSAITPSDTQTFSPGAGFVLNVTVPGVVKVGFANGFSEVIQIGAPGLFTYPWSINQIFVTGTSAVFSAFTI